MTRTKDLPAVLNVRLDGALAAEVERIARSSGRTRSDVVRSLLGYGVDVWRQLEADELAQPFRSLGDDGDAPS